MRSFLFLLLFLGACTEGVMRDAASHEQQRHDAAAATGSFSQDRWGYAGIQLDSVQRLLSVHLGAPVWCYPKEIRDVSVARCTSKRHLDSVSRGGDSLFHYSYYPQARYAGISKPIFLDDCYRCGRRLYYRYR